MAPRFRGVILAVLVGAIIAGGLLALEYAKQQVPQNERPWERVRDDPGPGRGVICPRCAAFTCRMAGPEGVGDATVSAAKKVRSMRPGSHHLLAAFDGIPLVIPLDRIGQPFENIGNGAGHTTPVGDHRDAQWILDKGFGRQLHAF